MCCLNMCHIHHNIITGPPNGPVLFSWLASVVVYNAAGGWAGRPPGTWTVDTSAAGSVGGQHCTAGQYGYVPLGRHLVKLKDGI